jgi:hypothetical protein
MKKPIFITLLVLFSVFAFYACGGHSHKGESTEHNHSAKVEYTCTMHPEVHSDQPGKCPKCGMELVKKEVSESDSTHMHHDKDSAEHHH